MTASPLEAIARDLCRRYGHPEDALSEGEPMWRKYLPEARIVFANVRDRVPPGKDPEIWRAIVDATLRLGDEDL